MADLNGTQNNLSNGQVQNKYKTTYKGLRINGPPDPEDPILKMGIDTLSFPADRPKYFASIQICNYNRASIMAMGDLKAQSTVYLPLPVQLNDTQIVQWVEHEIGLTSAPAFSAGLGLANKNLGDAAKNTALTAGVVAAGAAAGTAAGSVARNPIGNLAEQAIAGAAKSGLEGFMAGSGVAFNQFVVVIMKGPTYKKYNMTWRLSPRTAAEAESVRTIIKELNNAMAPATSFGGYLFTYPKVIKMAFSPNSKYLFKFKPAVITTCNFNYSPGGTNAFYHDHPNTDNISAPESVDITMQIMELEYWLTGDFTDSKDPYDVHAGSGR